MRFINFLILKLAACLTLGIMLGHHFPSTPIIGVSIFLSLLVLLLISWFLEARRLRQGPLFGAMTLLLFISLGYVNLQKNQPHFLPEHYLQISPKTNQRFMELKIVEVLKSDRYHHKYYAKVLSIQEHKSNGRVLLSIKNDAQYPKLKVDNALLVAAKIDTISSPLNPGQFNYKSYLHSLGVFARMRISEGEILKIDAGKTTLKGLSEGLRSGIAANLDETDLSADAKAITKALVLGERSTLDKELYGNYAAAGAIHILAVSGLHVGILFLLFSWMLKPLDYFRKGKTIKAISIVLLLWGFALLAGLSPSVVRAVTMFSFFALAKTLNRRTHGFNTLALSYFVLLLVQPGWLFHVGFQLSYLAVFFILWLQPNLYRLYRPKTSSDRYLWGLITVTLSAQIGVAPLSLYYFHQFPGLFLLTNMVVLPFLGILLGLGLLTTVWSVWGKVPYAITSIYNWAIGLLNSFVDWIAAQESFLFSNIPFSLPKMLSIYALIFSLVYLWKTKHSKLLLASLASITLFVGILRWEKAVHATQQFVVFHKARKSLMTYKDKHHLTVFTNDTLDPTLRYPLKGYGTVNHITENTLDHLPNVFQTHGKYVLRLDSLGVYGNRRVDIVILSESPKIHLDRLIDSIQPRLIIADGSNYKSYVKRWKVTCSKRKLPFHNTSEMGAYILE